MEEYYKIIADQVVELKQLREKVEDYEKRFSNIRMNLYCVGGPLNDNAYLYTGLQQLPFNRIALEASFNENDRREIQEYLDSNGWVTDADTINGYQWSKERDGKIKIHWEK